MSEYNSLLTHLDRILEGKEQYIPNKHVRMRETFNLHKGRYILVGSDTNVGKTSLVDDSIVLYSFEWLMQQSFDYYFKIPYYSMERATRDKLAKWLSWKIYQDKGLKIPSNVFSVGSQGDIKLNDSHTKLAKEYEPWMTKVLDHIIIKQGPQWPKDISNDIEQIAKETLYKITTDAKNIFVDSIKQGEFNPEVTKLRNKKNVMYRTLNIAKEKVDVYPNETIYVLKTPNTYVFIILDHLGKLRGDSKKSAIDEMDLILSMARDNYYMSPIAVSQFNRSVGDITRIKFSSGSLEPQLSDYKDSSNPAESADLVIAPFDAYRYNSYSKEGLYHGYNVANSMNPSTLSPSGNQRFRSLHVLKNSYGPSQITYGMRFTGEVMDFKLLPLPNDPELIKVYEEIALNK
jgi:hypothetical protein